MSQFSISAVTGTQAPSQATPLQTGDIALVARALAGAIHAAPVGGTPLSLIVQQASAAMAGALGGSADPVGSGRLSAATADFAREVKALFVGGIDRSPAALGAELESALQAGTHVAAALPAVGLKPVDHAITFFSSAAQALAQSSAPLAPTPA